MAQSLILMVVPTDIRLPVTKCVSKGLWHVTHSGLSASYGDEWSTPKEAHATRGHEKGHDTSHCLRVIQYWLLLAYGVHRLAFPAAFFKNQRISVTAKVESTQREAIMLEFERSRSRLVELRETAPSTFFPGLVQVLSAREDGYIAVAALHETNLPGGG